MSVNEAWQGRKFKTPKYKAYEKELLMRLPAAQIPEGNLRLTIEFGFSSSAADCSNPIKLVEDILQKKYGFNDNRIYEIFARKIITKKGAEFINILIESTGAPIAPKVGQTP